MTSENENTKFEIINRQDKVGAIMKSGFPFQTKVAHILRETHWFQNVLEEQAWSIHGLNDFIDIVCFDVMTRYVIECKKQDNDNNSLIFLAPREHFNSSNNMFFWAKETAFSQSAPLHLKDYASSWDALPSGIEAPLAKQCVIQQKKNANAKEVESNLLETIGAQLINSVEGFAAKEFMVKDVFIYGVVYIPVIITTAPIYICNYSVDDVDIKTGEMRVGDGIPELTPVSFVRFRKSMGISSCVERKEYTTMDQMVTGSERTIIVVNSEHILDFFKLKNIIMRIPESYRYPYEHEKYK